MRPALLAPGRVISHDELDRLPRPEDALVVVRGAPRLPSALAIHAALAHDHALAPIAADASAAFAAALAARIASQPRGAPSIWLSTSGSTGTPKLVELSRAAWRSHCDAARSHLGLDAADRWLCTLPLHHTGGLSILLRCRQAGAAVVLDEAPRFGPAWAAWLLAMVRDAQVTRLSLVPAQLDLLVAGDHAAPSQLRSVIVGGQALAAPIAERAVALGWPIIASYGLTETCGMCVATRPGELDAGSGRALGDTRLRISADGTLELAGGAIADAVHDVARPFSDDGWLRTADRARLDGDRLFVLGRADDVITSGGHKIDPLEIEAALRRLPFVCGAAIAGVDDARFGARLGALVVLDPRTPDARARLEAALAQLLPRHQRPRTIVCAAELPLMASGKIDRAAVRLALAH